MSSNRKTNPEFSKKRLFSKNTLTHESCTCLKGQAKIAFLVSGGISKVRGNQVLASGTCTWHDGAGGREMPFLVASIPMLASSPVWEQFRSLRGVEKLGQFKSVSILFKLVSGDK